jgi:hypothetical protein
MAYRSLPRFNPEARFIANRAFLYDGQQIQPGQVVDFIPTLRLKAIYHRRDVLMAPAPAAQKEAAHAARKGKGK